MLDLALIRSDPDRVKRACKRRGFDAGSVDEILALDERWRTAQTTSERLKAEKNALTASIGRAPDRAATATELRPKLGALDEQIDSCAQTAEHFAPTHGGSPLRVLLEQIPNLLDDSVPDGDGPQHNAVLREHGTSPQFNFAPLPHWELGERLGIIDFERAVTLSGSRFSILKGRGAQLARALVTYFLDRSRERGYEELAPPFLVSEQTMWSTGQLTKFSDAMFADRDGLFLIPTAEVPLTAYHSGEILPEEMLPLRYAAYSPCFRKEAGAAGKDTRGLIRQHQFEKVELVRISRPEDSFAQLEELLGDAERLLQELELPHRVVALCAGDVSFNAAKTYDLEVWIPSQNDYREISSCSNCTDFQARRANIRFRRSAPAKPEFVHALNGSGLAVGRTLLAILENFQQADGSVTIPAVLQPYTGFARIGA